MGGKQSSGQDYQSSGQDSYSRSRIVVKGTPIHKTSKGTFRAGGDTVSFRNVSPQYLDVYLAVAYNQTMIHVGTLFKAHGEQIDASWSRCKYTQMLVHLLMHNGQVSVKFDLSDSDSTAQEDVGRILQGTDGIELIHLGIVVEDELARLANVANSEIKKCLVPKSLDDEHTNCFLFTKRLIAAAGLRPSEQDILEKIPAILKNQEAREMLMISCRT